MYFDLVISILLGFAIVAAIMPFAIPELHKLKFGQEVRDDGPQSHLKKQGTPTMGGIVFIIAIAIVSVIFMGRYPKIIPVLLLTIGFGIVGFVDDYLKVVKHQSEGFNPKQKSACQFIITLIFAVYLYLSPDYTNLMKIPFTEIYLNFGWFYIPVLLFIVLGTDNGANFTDGIDGLASSVTAVIAIFIAFVSMYKGDGELLPMAGGVFGSLLGFLVFNCHPAKIFMGDTGSLALGGFVAAASFEMGIPLFIPIFALIYLVEVLSVIIQVTYFKATHGKRVFRMAPIHHHYELGGWSETKVVTVFTIITILLCLVAALGM
ncbi:phospho-N-acetylmuramoyl-pentapeptide-transferase [Oribacterium sp. WCC10]|uniref:phospho-N-acetylmuramoyl-pentapeptide- transferase n=1 Tax=Oribacterium sp. WCC10 TaxID=1855343 RepID=UPI0008E32D31|nr:phospho-N-acetylmuramoyl-pentapeptide-transferase [Oribacterium sp. WCC10]SFG26469.1 Phospho-N-acetylmuramoyl-pentapeptide-transferase [Oribacterium sp. WCC10]